jgi:hypothetical protein
VSTAKVSPPSGDFRESKAGTALIAAYREGLGLSAIAIIRTATGIRIVALENGGDGSPATGGNVVTQWWCRRSADAARIAAAATARMRRLESKNEALMPAAPVQSDSTQLARRAIAAAARQCGEILYSDEETSAAAMALIARVDEEIDRLQRAGGLKSVNRSYRIYRTEATARGDTALPYAKWLNEYKANLVRQLAAALRFN